MTEKLKFDDLNRTFKRNKKHFSLFGKCSSLDLQNREAKM